MNDLINRLLMKMTPEEVYVKIAQDYREIWIQSLWSDVTLDLLFTLVATIVAFLFFITVRRCWENGDESTFVSCLMFTISIIVVCCGMYNTSYTIHSPNHKLMSQIQHQYEEKQKQDFTAKTGIGL